MPGLWLLWPAKALSPAGKTWGGAQATGIAVPLQVTRALAASSAAYASGTGIRQAVRGLLAAGVSYAEARGLSQATRGLLATGLTLAVAAEVSQAVRGLRAAGTTAALDRCLAQAIRGLRAQGEAYALDAALLGTFHGQIQALLARGSAAGSGAVRWTGIIHPLSAVGLAVAADLGLMSVKFPVFTRGTVSVRSGDARMPGIAVPDPRW